MSDAALKYVRACTHPKVKGATRALFDAIAHFVPEGETTTPYLGMKKDLAAQARLDRRTVIGLLPDLVEIGEVLVVDGGQGRPARYQIVHLDGARPITAAPLPLRADLQPVPPRPRPLLPEDTTGDLFDPIIDRREGEQPAINLWSLITSTPFNLWSLITSWGAYLWSLITSTRFVRSKSEELVIRTCDPTCDPALPLDVDDARARDVLLLKETTTTAPPSDPPRPRAVESPPCGSPPCRYFGTRHAWCGGRMHVPKLFHLEELRRLARRAGETDAELEARLFGTYAAILAGLPDSEPILDKNDFEFWKRMLRTAAPSTSPPRVNRRDGSTCLHEPHCRTDRDCIERVIADGRAARERKSG